MIETVDPAEPWPQEIRVHNHGKELSMTFDSGEKFDFSAEYLRVESPSAEVKGHGKGQEKTIPGKRYVTILSVEPVGNYAIRISFDDMHSTGIYSWNYLLKLASEYKEIWQTYLNKLEYEGLSRD